MIGLIGTKRLTMLAALVAANAALGGAAYAYLAPQNMKLDRELKTATAQVASKRSEAQRLRDEIQTIQEEKEKFELLESAGFLEDQDRLDARKTMEAVQSYARVLSARYNIDPGVIQEIDETNQAPQVLLNSPIKVDVDALDDVDVYNFLYLMENAFPGHVAVKSIALERKLDLNEVTLRQIGSGIPTVMMAGEIVFDWKTMLARDKIVTEAGLAPPPGN